MASSSSSPSPKDYQVFLSFRGEDTRRTFLSHLYGALTRYGIRTFKDDRELRKGGSISPELLRAIEHSQIAVVVMSRNYASSSWCLEELVKIMECQKSWGLQVIPVFYNIDPSHVRRRKRSFEEAFVKHKDRFEEDKLREWEKILAEVGSISGWDSRNWDDEFEFINNIVRDVSDRLFPMSSGDTSYLVGMDVHMKSLDNLLCAECEDVRMMGLWGMGGIGKTTIARCYYDRVRQQFEHCCFIDNAKKDFRKLGISGLQELLLSQIFRDRELKLWDAGTNVIKDRLCCKKVLIVLDDVNELDQLCVLAGELNWFGPGSRIIITTRNRRLLENHKVQDVYEVKHLNNDEALHLFSVLAFDQKWPEEDFSELSFQVINYVGGLPLGIKVLGSLLRNRESYEWEDTLHRLSRAPPDNILEVLRISYDGLEDEEKDIFLCIACGFNGEYVNNAIRILDGCSFHAHLGIKNLAERSLITITNTQQIRVHDLLRIMACVIVYQDNPRKPWKRKILSNKEDINYLFTASEDWNKIIEAEAIFADMSEGMELHLHRKAFKGMHNLKLLKIFNSYRAGESRVHVPEDLDCFPRKTRYLYWDGLALKSLPSGFCPEFLVELALPNSNVQKLWEGTQASRSLKVMNLRRCYKLVEIPDLSKATNLERLELSYCRSLEYVSPSLGKLQKLCELKLNHCKKLEKLPSNINLNSLRFLYLEECSCLSEFPCISKTVEELFLSGTLIVEVPPSIEHLSRLVELQMIACTRLKYLPSTIQNLKSLVLLGLSGCSNVTEFPEVGESIQMLNLEGTAIRHIPPYVWVLPSLVDLRLSNYERLHKPVSLQQDMERDKWMFLQLKRKVHALSKEREEFSKLVKKLFRGLEELMQIEWGRLTVEQIDQQIRLADLKVEIVQIENGYRWLFRQLKELWQGRRNLLRDHIWEFLHVVRQGVVTIRIGIQNFSVKLGKLKNCIDLYHLLM